jgi:glycosyltransferase involved in cell wall biosynthesis
LKTTILVSPKIIVNATALDRSGALTILEQFIEAIPADKFEYVVFVDSGVDLSFLQSNITIVKKKVKGLLRRFIWDSLGVRQWLKKNKVKAIATISLQNTNFRTEKSIPNFIYFHNSIPLSPIKWNMFRSKERPLWFYKNIYPFFVRLFINEKTEIFVQTGNIRESFAAYFDIPLGRIHVIRPKSKLSPVSDYVEVNLEKEQLNLFYPATPFIYKNHSSIIKALNDIGIEQQKQITLHLTCQKDDLKDIVRQPGGSFRINFMGKIDLTGMFRMYKCSDALLFPSYIETIGLPIIEAASTGLPIIAADLPYAREALREYKGAVFIPAGDPEAWRQEILKLLGNRGIRYQPMEISISDSWNELFRIIENRVFNIEQNQ